MRLFNTIIRDADGKDFLAGTFSFQHVYTGLK